MICWTTQLFVTLWRWVSPIHRDVNTHWTYRYFLFFFFFLSIFVSILTRNRIKNIFFVCVCGTDVHMIFRTLCIICSMRYWLWVFFCALLFLLSSKLILLTLFWKSVFIDVKSFQLLGFEFFSRNRNGLKLKFDSNP